MLLARDTLRWWTNNPGAEGWEFEHHGIFAGFFPFKIEPLRLDHFTMIQRGGAEGTSRNMYSKRFVKPLKTIAIGSRAVLWLRA